MNNLAIVTQENEIEVKLRATANELCDIASSVMIFSRPDLSHATDLVKAIKTRTKEIEEERTRIVKPFNEGIKAINSRFKAMTAPLEEAETSVKAKMLAFQKEEDKRVQAEQARIAKAAQEAAEKAQKEAAAFSKEKGNDDDIRSMPLPSSPVALAMEYNAPLHRPTTYGQTGAVSTVKKVWAFELADIKALANARPDLVMVDTVKINQLIRGVGGDIPGLRIFQDEILTVR